MRMPAEVVFVDEFKPLSELEAAWADEMNDPVSRVILPFIL